jgi:AraC family transcriptional regulator
MNLTVTPITLGERLFSIRAGDFTLTQTRHQPDLRINKHIHQSLNLVCVINGSFVEKLRHRGFQCASGSLLVKPAGEVHSNHYGRGGAECLIIEVNSDWYTDRANLLKPLNQVAHFQAPFLSPLILQIRTEMSLAGTASRLIIEGLVIELLGKLVRQGCGNGTRRKPAWLQQALDFLNAHYREHFTLSDLAQAVGVHPSHLSRAFQNQYRCSVGNYVRSLRLNEARRRLSLSQEPIADIAVDLGFHDQSHFTHVYKNHTGLTPAEFRVSARSGGTLNRKI